MNVGGHGDVLAAALEAGVAARRARLLDGGVRRPEGAPDLRGRPARRRRRLRRVEDRGRGGLTRDFGRRGLEFSSSGRRRSSARSGSASSRSCSTGCAKAAGSTSSASGTTATSCSRSRISSTRSCSPPSGRRPRGRRSTSARRSSAPCGRTSSALIDHAGSSSRLTPFPREPAEIALRALELARLSPLAEWHYKTAHRDSFVDDRQGESSCSAGTPRLSNAEALCRTYDWYLAHRECAAGGGRDAPRAVEPAGARPAQADQLTAPTLPPGTSPRDSP